MKYEILRLSKEKHITVHNIVYLVQQEDHYIKLLETCVQGIPSKASAVSNSPRLDFREHIDSLTRKISDNEMPIDNEKFYTCFYPNQVDDSILCFPLMHIKCVPSILEMLILIQIYALVIKIRIKIKNRERNDIHV